jgi:hypothetical protein
MKRAVAVLLLLAPLLRGQGSAKADAAAQAALKTLKEAASAGLPIPAAINVADNVNIEAVLLPFEVARRVFGGEVAKNYAVIAVNISNRSNEAGFVLHSLFINLQDWGFAGPMSSGLNVGGVRRSAQPKSYQAQADPLEVSSVEYRIVRGGMLDRQPWTARNVGLRVIQSMGSIGVAFAFPFTRDVVTGIAAWNGAVIPAYQALFPDGMQAQLDRVSDYGFRNNKIFPQQAADIVVAFFPIKRFLTPTLERVFRESPALFFNPILIALDPRGRALVDPLLQSAFKKTDGTPDKVTADLEFFNLLKAYSDASTGQLQLQQDLRKVGEASDAVAADQAATSQDNAAPTEQSVKQRHTDALNHDQTTLAAWQKSRDTDQEKLDRAMYALAGSKLYGLLASLSLNNVHLEARGIMTVDVDSVPPILTSVECSRNNQKSDLMWAEPGDLVCAIRGSFLSNGTPAIAEATALGGLTAGTVAAGSTDALLNFKLTLPKGLDPKAVLTFTVTKKNKQGNTVESMKFPFTVPDYSLPAPSVSKVAVDGSTVTVTGANFYDTPKAPLAVTAHSLAPKDAKDQSVATPARTLTQIQFDAKAFPSACYQVQVKVGSAQAASTDKPPKDEFPWFLKPAIVSATLDGSSLKVALDQLFNLPDCGAPGAALTFQVLSDGTGAKPQAVANPQFLADGKTATLTMPAFAGDAKSWKTVEALINGNPMQPPVTASITK